jgi:hypothetical protein
MPATSREKQKSPPAQRNEGEGNRTAARAYNKATRDYVAAGKVGTAAAAARRALESPEGKSLKAAEAKGRSRARH